MIGWEEVFIVAFTTQLAALPGEKVQFIIAGLATKYRPSVVVGAAGLAFGLWTVLEIWVGNAIRTVLPGVYLTAFTGGLFALFAIWLYRSAPRASSESARSSGEAEDHVDELDLSLFGYDVPQYLGGFVPIFLLMAAGEFGDKTQLVTIGLAATYGAHPAIWFGEMAAIIPVSMANAAFFHSFSPKLDRRLAHLAGATLFAVFALDSMLTVVAGFSLWETTVDAIASAFLLLG
ncbi:MAG: TMEM165/GDT1 family protein [Halobacteriota archaeon]